MKKIHLHCKSYVDNIDNIPSFIVAIPYNKIDSSIHYTLYILYVEYMQCTL